MPDSAIAVALSLVAAPLLQGVIKKAKAFAQGRVGPPITQTYFDLWKLARKGSVVPESATWLFHASPWVLFGTTIAASALVPTIAIVEWRFGDAILFGGLLALGRIALVLAAYDSGSNFAGMGASREIAIGAVVEPALIGALTAIALGAGTTSFDGIVAAREMAGLGAFGPASLLAFVALLLVAVAETGRVPVDNPDTHLELTMAHEGMTLEYSGQALGLIAYAGQIKQLAILSLVGVLILPIGMLDSPAVAFVAWAVRLIALGLVLAVIESANAKLRILRVREIMATAVALGGGAILARVALGG
ncbi:MAG: formate hydrogenlyase [Chloroflexota bacterium]|nr:MAG: formate hydrogenlyase [Chloroflexota bacterium]